MTRIMSNGAGACLQAEVKSYIYVNMRDID